MKRLFYLLSTLLISNGLAQVKQVGLGQWREHLPYNIAYDLCHTGSEIYVGSNFSSFYYDLRDYSQNPLGKAAGYADFDISEIGYNKQYNAVIIGYKSGMIDVKINSTIHRVNDISRALFDGSKTINHIFCKGAYAYISGDFGLSVLDLEKREIKESYRYLTITGSNNKVYSSTLSDDGDSIFLATEKGLMTARVSPSVNLLDFNNWYTLPPASGMPTSDVVGLCYNNGILYAGVNFRGVFYYNGSNWIQCQFMWDIIKSLQSSYGKVTYCHFDRIYTINSPTSSFFVKDSLMPLPYEAVYDASNTLWVASSGYGLLKFENNIPHPIHPSGPETKNSFNLLYNNNAIIACAGGYNETNGFTYNSYGFYYFDENQNWSTVDSLKQVLQKDIFDLNYAVYNPVNKKCYLSAYIGGLIEMSEDRSIRLLNHTNTPMDTSVLGFPCVTGTAIDASGNIWVCNKISPAPRVITVMTPTYQLVKKIQLPVAGDAHKILFDDVGNTWIVINDHVGNRGLVVMRSNGTFVDVKSYLPSVEIKAIEKDKKGAVWIGTEKGIAICYDPSEPTKITTPIFEGFPLLYERVVQSIEIDGGNRKWVGTNNGLWLFNDDATEVELYFDTKNAPMPSSNIVDLEIHELTGEVFIATELGTVSYRGDATEGVKKQKDITVFPNPVKPGYTGSVGIQGLTMDAEVKITDVYGTLVYQCKATGGMAQWNVKDYNGVRAKTGVYLIFCSNADGTEGVVGRIAVVE